MRRLKHMGDRRPDHGRVADGNHMAAEGGFTVHPAGDACSEIKKAFATMRGRFRIAHPGHEVPRLFGLDRCDRPAGPAAMVAITQRLIYPGFEAERVSGLAGAQSGAGGDTVGAGWGSHPAGVFRRLAFQRFVKWEQRLAARRRRAVADPGEARIHSLPISRGAVGRPFAGS